MPDDRPIFLQLLIVFLLITNGIVAYSAGELVAYDAIASTACCHTG